MIPPPVQTLIEIFSTDLADLRFADMDAKGLSEIATEVQSATDALATAQAAVDAARAKLLERQEAMMHYAQRALAYARIYAETNEPLRARLEGISLPRPAKRAKGEESPAPSAADPSIEAPAAPRRGRRRKADIAAEAANAGATETERDTEQTTAAAE